MVFLPAAILMFVLFLLFLPVLLLLVYFNVLTVGFGKLGVPTGLTFLILLGILIGSAINIPLTRKKLVYAEESRFFGLFRTPKIKEQFIAINLGGAVIPILLSFYFLSLGWQNGFNLQPVLFATLLMIFLSKYLARVVPGRGISLPAFIPPVFSAIFAMMLSPDFAAATAFISGVFGTLIGADLLNIRKFQRMGSGLISIGGAGVFDGIFLVGIVSALIAG